MKQGREMQTGRQANLKEISSRKLPSYAKHIKTPKTWACNHEPFRGNRSQGHETQR
jgi:hypothetical protein